MSITEALQNEKKTTTTKKKSTKKRAPKRKPRKSKPSVKESKQVEESPDDEVYPEVEAHICIGSKALTADKARELLGWRMEPKDAKWSSDQFLFKDLNGAKVQCFANVTNRPLYMNNVDALKQEVLRKKWRFNGEPIIISKTGKVLNGQHQLVALVFAVQEWEKYPGKWIEWQEEPTIDKLIVFGVDEDDEIVNTMDTCKPRTLMDVLYRSEYFKDVKPKERKSVARACSFAINTLWERMGADHAFAPRQTHSESLDFLSKHPKILEAVNHVLIEDGEGNFAKYLSPGYAAGMMYLMGSSKSDTSEYISNPCEASLDFSNWDKAEEFVTLICHHAKEMNPLITAMANLLNEEDGGSRKERLALLCKAWQQWVSKGKLGKLSLKYRVVDEVKQLAEEPSVGGIDLIEYSKEEAESGS